MGSCISNEDCPNCKWEGCVVETYTNGHQWAFCERCGYAYNNGNGTEEGAEETKNPKGAWRIMIKGTGGKVGRITNLKEIQKGMKSFVKEEKDVEVCCYTFKKGKKWYVHDLLNNRKMLHSEWLLYIEALQELER